MYKGQRLTLDRQDACIACLRFHNPPDGFRDDATERELGAALDAIDAEPGAASPPARTDQRRR